MKTHHGAILAINGIDMYGVKLSARRASPLINQINGTKRQRTFKTLAKPPQEK
jgi:hypothetical protein